MNAKILGYEATAEDVQAAAAEGGLDVDMDRAEEILGSLDLQAIEKAALYGDDIDEQTTHAQAEIRDQLTAQGLLPTPNP